MAERTVLIAGFAYTEERPLLFDAEGRITSDEEIGTPVTDEHGEPVILKIRHLAKYGETVDFSDADIARGEEIGAFDPPPIEIPNVVTPQGAGDEPKGDGEPPAPAEDPEGWLREARPSVKDVLEAAGTDKELAQRLLDAEDAVTDGKPRKGVVEGLTALVDAQGDGQPPAPAEDQ